MMLKLKFSLFDSNKSILGIFIERTIEPIIKDEQLAFVPVNVLYFGYAIGNVSLTWGRMSEATVVKGLDEIAE